MADKNGESKAELSEFDQLWKREMLEWARILGGLNEQTFDRVVREMISRNMERIIVGSSLHSPQLKARLLRTLIS